MSENKTSKSKTSKSKTSTKTPQLTFEELGLTKPVLKALNDVGYEQPTPIQSEIIPYVLEGRDVLGQAQTGTGKTAAFALPLLSRIDFKGKDPQVLVLAPTRELAIQVAEAFQRYASGFKDFHVLPIYGGQDYSGQLRQLKRGVNVVVGTPGRVMDHMRKGTLKLKKLDCLVLDEADEMLRMGFIDDVEWILEQTPAERQTALFSATMPKEIRHISKRYLRKPQEITIKDKTTTTPAINQRYWLIGGLNKLDALTRILEAETFEGIIIFVRTRLSTVELADRLKARGYAASAINGDMDQKQRERTIAGLKSAKLDILVATDVAARGLDVDRISHVINYDIPYDVQSYVHRIGRTGRAGRSGEAILFVAPRERRLLYSIEKATNQSIKMLELPSAQIINKKRIASFKDRITETLANQTLTLFQQIIEQYRSEHEITIEEVAAALAQMAQGDTPLLLKDRPIKERNRDRDEDRERGNSKRDRGNRKFREGRSDLSETRDRGDRRERRDPRKVEKCEEGMERFRIAVGHEHSVKPGNIVGAIANESGMDADYIGRIKIYDDYSTVDLPNDIPKDTVSLLKKVWVAGQQLQICIEGSSEATNQKPVSRKKEGGRFSSRKNENRRDESDSREERTHRDNRKKREERKAELKKESGPGEKPSKFKSKEKSKEKIKVKTKEKFKDKPKKKDKKDKPKKKDKKVKE